MPKSVYLFDSEPFFYADEFNRVNITNDLTLNWWPTGNQYTQLTHVAACWDVFFLKRWHCKMYVQFIVRKWTAAIPVAALKWNQIGTFDHGLIRSAITRALDLYVWLSIKSNSILRWRWFGDINQVAYSRNRNFIILSLGFLRISIIFNQLGTPMNHIVCSRNVCPFHVHDFQLHWGESYYVSLWTDAVRIYSYDSYVNVISFKKDHSYLVETILMSV